MPTLDDYQRNNNDFWETNTKKVSATNISMQFTLHHFPHDHFIFLISTNSVDNNKKITVSQLFCDYLQKNEFENCIMIFSTLQQLNA